MAGKSQDKKDAVEASQEVTEQTPPEKQDERGEGVSQDQASGKDKDAGFGGGNEGEADHRYSPGAETINPAFTTDNQGDPDSK